LMRRETAVLMVVGLSSGACGESETNGCATVVSAEVCETPSNLRGAEPVQETWSSEPAPELVAQPLFDGRYVLTARTHYCSTFQAPSAAASSVQSVMEVKGCVLRATSMLSPGELASASAGTFEYAGDGTLELRVVCPAELRATTLSRYGFDGTTLHLAASAENTDAEHQAEGCERLDLDTFELR